LFISIILKI